jgi:hypothetical protein
MWLYSWFTARAEMETATPIHEGFSKELGNPFFVMTEGRASIDTLLTSEPDFSLQPAQAAVTVARGAAATFRISAMPTRASFDQPITFSCGSIPAPRTCTFAPAQITPGSTGADVAHGDDGLGGGERWIDPWGGRAASARARGRGCQASSGYVGRGSTRSSDRRLRRFEAADVAIPSRATVRAVRHDLHDYRQWHFGLADAFDDPDVNRSVVRLRQGYGETTHSVFKTVIGSTRVARAPGTSDAAIAATASIAAMPARTAGSPGLTL